jgi:hypothetical protein
VEHLGCVIDTVSMRFYVAPRKIVKVRDLGRAILRQAKQGRRWVSSGRLRSFCGVCVSLSLAMPFARFYTCSLFDDLTRKTRASRAARNGSRCQPRHQATRDLRTWMRLATVVAERRPIRPLATNGIMHTDAADVGIGGTLALKGNPGDPGTWQDQGIWKWRDRAECISVRELKFILMLLVGQLGERVKREGISLLRLCIDNTSVFHVTNAFAASSRPMMRELRILKVVLDQLVCNCPPNGYPRSPTNLPTVCRGVSRLATWQ